MTESTDVAELPPALVAQFVNMVTLIPDAEPGDGADLVAQILGATTLHEVDAPWNGGRKAPIGPLLSVVAVTKSPSDYPGGLPFYLVLDHQTSPEATVKQFTVGGTMVVAQMVKFHELDEFPVVGTIVETPLKNRPGQSAQHWATDHEETARVRAAFKKGRGK